MNNSNEKKKASTATESIFLPPKPSCRKPLHRMMDGNPSVERSRGRYSSSPMQNFNHRYDNNSYDDSDISSDNSDDYNDDGDAIPERESSPICQRKLYPTLPSAESSRQRKSSRTPCDMQRETTESKSPGIPKNSTYSINNSEKYESSEEISEPARVLECRKIPRHSPPRGSFSSVSRKNSFSKANNQQKKTFIPKICVACAAVFVCAVLWFTLPHNVSSLTAPSKRSENMERLTNFREELKAISDTFPGQDRSTWRLIQVGVSEVIRRPEKPWIFVLFSNETKVLSCLAEKLGHATSRALLSADSLSLKPNDMGDDHGIAIDRFRNEIEMKKAVVVHDLLRIDSDAIQAFHTMCDRYNPLVKEAVYIMTIITRDYVPGVDSPERFVENQLTNRFIDKIPEDKLQPLITRITDGSIIPVKSEVSFTGCAA